MAPENPLQLGHEIAFFSELIEPEQATFQTVIDNYTKANVFLSCTLVITIFIIFFMDLIFISIYLHILLEMWGLQILSQMNVFH